MRLSSESAHETQSFLLNYAPKKRNAPFTNRNQILYNSNAGKQTTQPLRHYTKGVFIVNKKVLQTLEYYKIIDMLLEEADTPLAKESIRHLLPSSRREEIISWQTETSHALMRLLKQGRLPFHGLTDIQGIYLPV